jgi:hypothetical protein
VPLASNRTRSRGRAPAGRRTPVGGNALVVHGQSNAVADQGIVLHVGVEGPDLLSWDGSALVAADGDDGQGNEHWIGALGAHIGRQLIDYTVIDECYVFNKAAGGMEISWFEPGGSVNYQTLKDHVAASGIEPTCMVWVQGESDAVNGTTQAAYEASFDNLRAAWMSDWPQLRMIFVVQTSNPAAGADASAVRAAQLNLSLRHHNVHLIETDHITSILELYDGTHYTYLGYRTLGALVRTFIVNGPQG